jgi:hypothetical protein
MKLHGVFECFSAVEDNVTDGFVWTLTGVLYKVLVAVQGVGHSS